MTHVSMKKIVWTLVSFLLFSPMAFGQWTRPALPVPAEGALVATVGSVGCDFTSLREAVAAVPSGSVLRLAAETFTEGGTVLDKDLFIVGMGAQETIVQPSDSLETSTERAFLIETGATVVIQGITMRYGHPKGDCSRGGGALANFGDLWIDQCVVSDNIGQCGGGLMNRDGDVWAYDCLFLRNESDGGIDMTGIAGLGNGGGIKNIKGNMILDGCTVTGNVAKKKGGGVKNSCLGVLTMVNCTITGNSCKSGNVHIKGIALIDHCTIAFNTAPYSLGAGLYVDSQSVVRNTIVFGNTMGDVTVEADPDDPQPEFVNVWIGDARTELGTFGGDPLLGPLGDHGGLTWTYLLLPGSLAIDAAISSSEGPLVDQRGLPRPCGAASDLGAVEHDPTEQED